MKPILGLFAFILAAALLAWTLTRGEPSVAAPDVTSPAVAPAHPPSALPAGAGLDPLPAGATRAPEPAALENVALGGDSLPAWEREWLVHLELVRAAEFGPPVVVRIRTGGEGRELRVDFTEAGARRVDVTALRTRDVPEHMLVTVEGFQGENRSIQAARIEGTETTVEFAATIDIESWKRHFEGRVVLPIDHAELLEGGQVGVYVFDSDGRMVLARKCDPGGGFRVPLMHGEPYFVAAVAPGLAPHTERIEAQEGDWPLPREFALGEGAVIAGLGIVDGEPFGAGSTVSARRTEDEPTPLFLPAAGPAEAGLGWLDGQLMRIGALGRADAEGNFRITGLHPGRHDLVASPRPVESSGTRFGRGDGSTVSVDAPTDTALIDITSKSVTVVVRSGGAPLDGVLVRLQTVPPGGFVEWRETGMWSASSVDRDGRLRLEFESVTDYLLRFERAGYVAQTVELPGDTPDETQLDIDMEALEADASLLLRVTTDRSTPPARLTVRMQNQRLYTFLDRSVERGPAGYLLEGLPPGRFDVQIAPAASTGDDAFLLPAETILQLRAGSTLETGVVLATGGSLEVYASGFEAALVGARFLMRDGEHVISSALGGVESWRPGDVKSLTRPLPPGTYGLLLSAQGYEPWRGTVEIRPGEVARVAVELVPPR